MRREPAGSAKLSPRAVMRSSSARTRRTCRAGRRACPPPAAARSAAVASGRRRCRGCGREPARCRAPRRSSTTSTMCDRDESGSSARRRDEGEHGQLGAVRQHARREVRDQREVVDRRRRGHSATPRFSPARVVPLVRNTASASAASPATRATSLNAAVGTAGIARLRQVPIQASIHVAACAGQPGGWRRALRLQAARRTRRGAAASRGTATRGRAHFRP
jgi:hypothetical protein